MQFLMCGPRGSVRIFRKYIYLPAQRFKARSLPLHSDSRMGYCSTRFSNVLIQNTSEREC